MSNKMMNPNNNNNKSCPFFLWQCQGITKGTHDSNNYTQIKKNGESSITLGKAK